MITRFYVDNYKCLVNFEYKPKPMELIIGANGSGKTTVFEALECIKDFIVNQKKVEEVFYPTNLTRWQSRERVIFELQVSDSGKVYDYKLVLELIGFMSFIVSENLRINGKESIDAKFKSGVDGNGGDEEPINFNISFLEVSMARGGSTDVFRIWDGDRSAVGHSADEFIEALKNVVSVKLNPPTMLSALKTSQRHPSKSFANFPAYYLHLLQEKQSVIFDLLPVLRENIEGFRSFVLEERGPEARQLRVEFAVEGGKKGQTVRYDFGELSDGQRALIALYTLAFCESGSTLLIDEPENFISLRELQPWLMLLRERIEDFGGQAILISHHPEFINVLAPQDAIQFRRKDGGPVMIRPFEIAPDVDLTPAEIVARGWENE